MRKTALHPLQRKYSAANRRKLGKIAHALHGTTELAKVGQALGKVATGACEPADRHGRTVVTEFAFDQLQQHAAALGTRRRPADGVPGQERQGLAEDPGVAEAAAADRHGVRPAFPQPAQDVGGLADSSTAQNGHVHGLLHPCDDFPVRTADVGLSHAPGVDSNRGRARVLGPPGDFDRGFVLRVRSGAKLDGHGYRHGAGDGRDDPLDSGRVGHEGPSLAAGQHPTNGAFEVQIDQIKSLLLDDPRGCRHHRRFGTADLRGSGAFFGRRVQHPQRAAIPARHGGRVDAFRTNQAGPETLHQQTEREVRVLLHGSQRDRCGQTYLADVHRDAVSQRRGAGCRSKTPSIAGVAESKSDMSWRFTRIVEDGIMKLLDWINRT